MQNLIFIIIVMMSGTVMWQATHLSAATEARLRSPRQRSINASDSVSQPPLLGVRKVDHLTCVHCDECFIAWNQTLAGLETRAIETIERAYALDQACVHDIGVDASSGQPKLVIGGDGATMDDLESMLQRIGERILDNKRQSDLINLLVGEFDSIEQSLNTSKHDLASIPLNTDRLSARLADLNASMSSNFDLLKRVGKQVDERRQELVSIHEIASPMAAKNSITEHKNRSHHAHMKATEDNCKLSQEIDKFTAGFSTELARIRYLKRQMDLIGARILNNTIRIYLPEYYSSNTTLPSPLVDLGAFERNVSLVQESANSLAIKARQLLDKHQSQNVQINGSKTGNIESIKTDTQQAQLLISEASRKLAGFESTLTQVMTTHGLADDILTTLNNDTVQWIRAASNHVKVSWSNAQSELAELESKLVTGSGGGGQSVREQLVGLAFQVNEAFDEALLPLRELRDSLDKDSLQDVINLKLRTESLLKEVDSLRVKSSDLARIRRETRDLIEQTRRLCSV